MTKFKKTLTFHVVLPMLLLVLLSPIGSTACFEMNSNFTSEKVVKVKCGGESQVKETSHLHFSVSDPQCVTCVGFFSLPMEAISGNSIYDKFTNLKSVQKLAMFTFTGRPHVISRINTANIHPQNQLYRRTTVLLI